MRRVQYLSCFCIAFMLGVMVMHNFGDFELANSIANRQNKNNNYYEDDNDNFLFNRKKYLKQLKEDISFINTEVIEKMDFDINNN